MSETFVVTAEPLEDRRDCVLVIRPPLGELSAGFRTGLAKMLRESGGGRPLVTEARGETGTSTFMVATFRARTTSKEANASLTVEQSLQVLKDMGQTAVQGS